MTRFIYVIVIVISHGPCAKHKTPGLDLLASVRCHPLYILFTSSQGAVFLLNSRQGTFAAALLAQGRSYR